jgi:signal peptidase I
MASRFASPKLPSTASVTWRVAQLVGAVILFKDYVAEAALCAGESMLPTLRNEGDVLLVEKISSAFRLVRRGDVVVCVSPNDPDKLICKRVIGLVLLVTGEILISLGK